MLLSPHGTGNSSVSGLGSDTSVTGSSSSSYRCGKVDKHLSKRKKIEWNQKLKAFEMLRAASESTRSSYYSLHMEGLRWESNITFWSSGNQEAVKKEEKIGAVLNLEGALSLLEQDMMKKPSVQRLRQPSPLWVSSSPPSSAKCLNQKRYAC
ncbi:hypothetical protein Bca4012_010967 [Brassica carinata]|uniref:Uncharacterized protein n=1 Tax=Brassica carinata TaxID=52824 RepID=A0A8X7S1J1_BRACI|nr:hypothetical protein Bca52824_035865 [Brassica carinata]